MSVNEVEVTTSEDQVASVEVTLVGAGAFVNGGGTGSGVLSGTVGTSAPSSPDVGDYWLEDKGSGTPRFELKIYTGSSWEATSGTQLLAVAVSPSSYKAIDWSTTGGLWILRQGDWRPSPVRVYDRRAVNLGERIELVGYDAGDFPAKGHNGGCQGPDGLAYLAPSTAGVNPATFNLKTGELKELVISGWASVAFATAGASVAGNGRICFCPCGQQEFHVYDPFTGELFKIPITNAVAFNFIGSTTLRDGRVLFASYGHGSVAILDAEALTVQYFSDPAITSGASGAYFLGATQISTGPVLLSPDDTQDGILIIDDPEGAPTFRKFDDGFHKKTTSIYAGVVPLPGVGGAFIPGNANKVVVYETAEFNGTERTREYTVPAEYVAGNAGKAYGGCLIGDEVFIGKRDNLLHDVAFNWKTRTFRALNLNSAAQEIGYGAFQLEDGSVFKPATNYGGSEPVRYWPRVDLLGEFLNLGSTPHFSGL